VAQVIQDLDDECYSDDKYSEEDGKPSDDDIVDESDKIDKKDEPAIYKTSEFLNYAL
jgi:hypothetical protein